MESFKSYYFSRYQRGGGLPRNAAPAAPSPVLQKHHTTHLAKVPGKPVGALALLLGVFAHVRVVPQRPSLPRNAILPLYSPNRTPSPSLPPGREHRGSHTGRNSKRSLSPLRVLLRLAGIFTPIGLLLLALFLLKSPVFTQPNPEPGGEPPPLVVRQGQDLEKLTRIESTEGTNQYIRLDQIAELTDENGNELELETLNPYRLPDAGEERSPKALAKAWSPHRVQSGDSLWSIARKYRVNVDGILTLNRLSQAARLLPGTTLRIPRLPGVYYEVRKNDTVTSIARSFGLTVDEVGVYNELGTYLTVGTVLFLYRAKLSASMRGGAFGVGFSAPVRGSLSSPYGMRMHPILHSPLFHTGIDLAAEQGTRVTAAEEGTVSFAGDQGSYGTLVILRHVGGYESAYGHLSKLHTASGRRVKKGELIGEVGSTGLSTGPHLHFELRYRGQFVNPLRFISLEASPVASR